MTTQKFAEGAVGELFRIRLYYSTPQLLDGETILTATAAVTPVGLILVGGCVITGGMVEQAVRAMVAGLSLVQFTITTSGGDTYCNPDYDAIYVRVT